MQVNRVLIVGEKTHPLYLRVGRQVVHELDRQRVAWFDHQSGSRNGPLEGRSVDLPRLTGELIHQLIRRNTGVQRGA
jgi:hypothetical protein